MMPFAPGTWGTMVGNLIIIALWQMGLLESMWIIPIITIVWSMIGYWSITQLPEGWHHDDQRIVIDEVVGVWLTLAFIPISWTTIVLSFILFRVFDIWKPLGIRRFDNLKSDFSVIVDDLVAGVYANVSLRLVLLLLTAYGI